MKTISYRDMVNSGFEYEVRFCPECRDIELFHLVNGIWKCDKCKKRTNKNRRRKGEE